MSAHITDDGYKLSQDWVWLKLYSFRVSSLAQNHETRMA